MEVIPINQYSCEIVLDSLSSKEENMQDLEDQYDKEVNEGNKLHETALTSNFRDEVSFSYLSDLNDPEWNCSTQPIMLSVTLEKVAHTDADSSKSSEEDDSDSSEDENGIISFSRRIKNISKTTTQSMQSILTKILPTLGSNKNLPLQRPYRSMRVPHALRYLSHMLKSSPAFPTLIGLAFYPRCVAADYETIEDLEKALCPSYVLPEVAPLHSQSRDPSGTGDQPPDTPHPWWMLAAVGSTVLMCAAGWAITALPEYFEMWRRWEAVHVHQQIQSRGPSEPQEGASSCAPDDGDDDDDNKGDKRDSGKKGGKKGDDKGGSDKKGDGKKGDDRKNDNHGDDSRKFGDRRFDFWKRDNYRRDYQRRDERKSDDHQLEDRSNDRRRDGRRADDDRRGRRISPPSPSPPSPWVSAMRKTTLSRLLRSHSPPTSVPPAGQTPSRGLRQLSPPSATGPPPPPPTPASRPSTQRSLTTSPMRRSSTPSPLQFMASPSPPSPPAPPSPPVATSPSIPQHARLFATCFRPSSPRRPTARGKRVMVVPPSLPPPPPPPPPGVAIATREVAASLQGARAGQRPVSGGGDRAAREMLRRRPRVANDVTLRGGAASPRRPQLQPMSDVEVLPQFIVDKVRSLEDELAQLRAERNVLLGTLSPALSDPQASGSLAHDVIQSKPSESRGGDDLSGYDIRIADMQRQLLAREKLPPIPSNDIRIQTTPVLNMTQLTQVGQGPQGEPGTLVTSSLPESTEASVTSGVRTIEESQQPPEIHQQTSQSTSVTRTIPPKHSKYSTQTALTPPDFCNEITDNVPPMIETTPRSLAALATQANLALHTSKSRSITKVAPTMIASSSVSERSAQVVQSQHTKQQSYDTHYVPEHEHLSSSSFLPGTASRSATEQISCPTMLTHHPSPSSPNFSPASSSSRAAPPASRILMTPSGVRKPIPPPLPHSSQVRITPSAPISTAVSQNSSRFSLNSFNARSVHSTVRSTPDGSSVNFLLLTDSSVPSSKQSTTRSSATDSSSSTATRKTSLTMDAISDESKSAVGIVEEETIREGEESKSDVNNSFTTGNVAGPGRTDFLTEHEVSSAQATFVARMVQNLTAVHEAKKSDHRWSKGETLSNLKLQQLSSSTQTQTSVTQSLVSSSVNDISTQMQETAEDMLPIISNLSVKAIERASMSSTNTMENISSSASTNVIDDAVEKMHDKSSENNVEITVPDAVEKVCQKSMPNIVDRTEAVVKIPERISQRSSVNTNERILLDTVERISIKPIDSTSDKVESESIKCTANKDERIPVDAVESIFPKISTNTANKTGVTERACQNSSLNMDESMLVDAVERISLKISANKMGQTDAVERKSQKTLGSIKDTKDEIERISPKCSTSTSDMVENISSKHSTHTAERSSIDVLESVLEKPSEYRVDMSSTDAAETMTQKSSAKTMGKGSMITMERAFSKSSASTIEAISLKSSMKTVKQVSPKMSVETQTKTSTEKLNVVEEKYKSMTPPTPSRSETQVPEVPSSSDIIMDDDKLMKVIRSNSTESVWSDQTPPSAGQSMSRLGEITEESVLLGRFGRGLLGAPGTFVGRIAATYGRSAHGDGDRGIQRESHWRTSNVGNVATSKVTATATNIRTEDKPSGNASERRDAERVSNEGGPSESGFANTAGSAGESGLGGSIVDHALLSSSSESPMVSGIDLSEMSNVLKQNENLSTPASVSDSAPAPLSNLSSGSVDAVALARSLRDELTAAVHERERAAAAEQRARTAARERKMVLHKLGSAHLEARILRRNNQKLQVEREKALQQLSATQHAYRTSQRDKKMLTKQMMAMHAEIQDLRSRWESFLASERGPGMVPPLPMLLNSDADRLVSTGRSTPGPGHMWRQSFVGWPRARGSPFCNMSASFARAMGSAAGAVSAAGLTLSLHDTSDLDDIPIRPHSAGSQRPRPDIPQHNLVRASDSAPGASEPYLHRSSRLGGTLPPEISSASTTSPGSPQTLNTMRSPHSPLSPCSPLQGTRLPCDPSTSAPALPLLPHVSPQYEEPWRKLAGETSEVPRPHSADDATVRASTARWCRVSEAVAQVPSLTEVEIRSDRTAQATQASLTPTHEVGVEAPDTTGQIANLQELLTQILTWPAISEGLLKSHNKRTKSAENSRRRRPDSSSRNTSKRSHKSSSHRQSRSSNHQAYSGVSSWSSTEKFSSDKRQRHSRSRRSPSRLSPSPPGSDDDLYHSQREHRGHRDRERGRLRERDHGHDRSCDCDRERSRRHKNMSCEDLKRHRHADQRPCCDIGKHRRSSTGADHSMAPRGSSLPAPQGAARAHSHRRRSADDASSNAGIPLRRQTCVLSPTCIAVVSSSERISNTSPHYSDSLKGHTSGSAPCVKVKEKERDRDHRHKRETSKHLDRRDSQREYRKYRSSPKSSPTTSPLLTTDSSDVQHLLQIRKPTEDTEDTKDETDEKNKQSTLPEKHLERRVPVTKTPLQRKRDEMRGHQSRVKSAPSRSSSSRSRAPSSGLSVSTHRSSSKEPPRTEPTSSPGFFTAVNQVPPPLSLPALLAMPLNMIAPVAMMLRNVLTDPLNSLQEGARTAHRPPPSRPETHRAAQITACPCPPTDGVPSKLHKQEQVFATSIVTSATPSNSTRVASTIPSTISPAAGDTGARDSHSTTTDQHFPQPRPADLVIGEISTDTTLTKKPPAASSTPAGSTTAGQVSSRSAGVTPASTITTTTVGSSTAAASMVAVAGSTDNNSALSTPTSTVTFVSPGPSHTTMGATATAGTTATMETQTEVHSDSCSVEELPTDAMVSESMGDIPQLESISRTEETTASPAAAKSKSSATVTVVQRGPDGSCSISAINKMESRLVRRSIPVDKVFTVPGGTTSNENTSGMNIRSRPTGSSAPSWVSETAAISVPIVTSADTDTFGTKVLSLASKDAGPTENASVADTANASSVAGALRVPAVSTIADDTNVGNEVSETTETSETSDDSLVSESSGPRAISSIRTSGLARTIANLYDDISERLRFGSTPSMAVSTISSQLAQTTDVSKPLESSEVSTIPTSKKRQPSARSCLACLAVPMDDTYPEIHRSVVDDGISRRPEGRESPTSDATAKPILQRANQPDEDMSGRIRSGDSISMNETRATSSAKTSLTNEPSWSMLMSMSSQQTMQGSPPSSPPTPCSPTSQPSLKGLLLPSESTSSESDHRQQLIEDLNRMKCCHSPFEGVCPSHEALVRSMTICPPYLRPRHIGELLSIAEEDVTHSSEVNSNDGDTSSSSLCSHSSHSQGRSVDLDSCSGLSKARDIGYSDDSSNWTSEGDSNASEDEESTEKVMLGAPRCPSATTGRMHLISSSSRRSTRPRSVMRLNPTPAFSGELQGLSELDPAVTEQIAVVASAAASAAAAAAASPTVDLGTAANINWMASQQHHLVTDSPAFRQFLCSMIPSEIKESQKHIKQGVQEK